MVALAAAVFLITAGAAQSDMDQGLDYAFANDEETIDPPSMTSEEDSDDTSQDQAPAELDPNSDENQNEGYISYYMHELVLYKDDIFEYI